MKQIIEFFIHPRKLKQLLMTVILMMYLSKSIFTTITSNIQMSVGKFLLRITDSVVDHNIDISKYKPLSGSSYIKLIKELGHPNE